MTKRRRQRLDYVRAYAAYWLEGDRGGKVERAARLTDLEQLEAKMALDLLMRYRGLTREIGARLGGRWWEVRASRDPRLVAAQAQAAELQAAEAQAAAAASRKKEKGFDLFGMFKKGDQPGAPRWLPSAANCLLIAADCFRGRQADCLVNGTGLRVDFETAC